MQRHLVIGKGNLGCDIYDAALRAGHKAMILTKSNGFVWPESLEQILQWQPTHVWVTAGVGSVEAVKQNFAEAVKTHVTLPVELCKQLPAHVHLGLFSSDYVTDEKVRSLYACTKIFMEQALQVINRPNTSVFRVGSLYGHHYPLKGLPGKLKLRYPNPQIVKLPQNWITPTPTWWVAEILMEHPEAFSDRLTIHSIAPGGGCTVMRWGQSILGEEYRVDSKGFDEERPASTSIGCTLESKVKDWFMLYVEHLQRQPKADHSAAI